MATRIHLTEDNDRLAEMVMHAIALRGDMQLVGRASTLTEAMTETPEADIYLIDLGLPDGNGCALIEHLKRLRPQSERLVFTVFGDESRLIEALQAGATGYVLKGNGMEELMSAIEHARQGGAPVSPILARLLLKHFERPLSASPAATAARVQAEDNPLTDKEIEVLTLISRGYLNREIAEEMRLSIHTVITHTKNIYRKLDVKTRLQATNAAKERRLL